MAVQLPPEAIELATRLFNAARAGQVDIFEQALSPPPGSRALPANLKNDKGDTLVMLAAYHGHASLVKLLLQHGADPNITNLRGQSPLAGAVFKIQPEIVDLLLESGADPDYSRKGSPNAVATMEVFKMEELYAEKFKNAPGKGKAKPEPDEEE